MTSSTDEMIERIILDAITERPCDICSAPNAKPVRDRFGSGIDYQCADCNAAQEAETFNVDAAPDMNDRAAIIRWLLRNDRNGCYGDREVREELQAAPMTLEEAREQYLLATTDPEDDHSMR